MAKTEMIRARVEPELKSQAEEVFSELGLSATEAITLFYTTGHPASRFAVRSENSQCRDHRKRCDRLAQEEGLTEYADLEDLKAKHG